MATFRIPILGFPTRPDNSGKVYLEPLDVSGSNDLFDHFVWVFEDDGTNKVGLHGAFSVPKNYVGSPTIELLWTSSLTTNSAVWDFDYRAIGGNDTESVDQASYQESVTATDAAPSAAFERCEVSMGLTGSNLAVDDLVQFYLALDGANASCTLAGDALLLAALFQYNDA